MSRKACRRAHPPTSFPLIFTRFPAISPTMGHVETSEPRVETFGCRLNAYESEVIREHLRASDRPHAIVFNTCAVTNEAERQARQAIRKARRENPDAEIVVTGCAAQIDPDAYAALPEVDLVVGNEEKLKLETWVTPGNDPVRVNDIMSVEETAPHMIKGFDGRARAFVQVQQGCDHRCTFCIIPYGRGNNRSAPIGLITEQVRELVRRGFSEVVLTGVDIASYGPDLPGQPSLGQMLRRLLAQVPELPRLRLSSLDPAAFDDDLFGLIENEPRLLPHLHLSAQAGDDMILKRMKRRHLRGDLVALTKKVKALRPDVVFGADLIAGFPTETEDMFQNSLALVEECDLTYLHVFPYSPRPGTPAANMPQVPGDVRKSRATALRAAGDARVKARLTSMIGKEVRVLVEKDNAGHSEFFDTVALSMPVDANRIVSATITGTDGKTLTADLTEREAA